jgi:hypothetical protein
LTRADLAGVAALFLLVFVFAFWRFIITSTTAVAEQGWAALAQTGGAARINFDWSAKILALSALLGPIDNTKSFPFLFLLLGKILPWHFSG